MFKPREYWAGNVKNLPQHHSKEEMESVSIRALWNWVSEKLSGSDKREVVKKIPHGELRYRRYLKWSDSGNAADAEKEIDISLTTKRLLLKHAVLVTLREEKSGSIVLDRGSVRDVGAILDVLMKHGA